MLALAGHAMIARWHLGPVTGFHFWLVLVTSPEVLVFLFFMITDPKTAPRWPRARLVYAVSLGLLASLLIAPTTTEFAARSRCSRRSRSCASRSVLRALPVRVDRRARARRGPGVLAAFAGVIVSSNAPAHVDRRTARRPWCAAADHDLPRRACRPSSIATRARLIAHDLLSSRPCATAGDRSALARPGRGQNPPIAVAQLAGQTYQLNRRRPAIGRSPCAADAGRSGEASTSTALAGLRLTNLAPSLGLDFQQGAFRYGMSSDTKAMMGGGVCWLDYNNDGWQDLFAVNSYASADAPHWEAHGGLPRTALFENVDGTFKDVSAERMPICRSRATAVSPRI